MKHQIGKHGAVMIVGRIDICAECGLPVKPKNKLRKKKTQKCYNLREIVG